MVGQCLPSLKKGGRDMTISIHCLIRLLKYFRKKDYTLIDVIDYFETVAGNK